jgi:nucleoside 2-deoxyribosyltransferase
MKYEYYIASSMRNKDTVLELTQKLRDKGKVVYCFVDADPQKNLTTDDIDVKDWRNSDKNRYIYQKDMTALKDSEMLILLLPAGKSAHIESGVAFGMGKKCFLIGQPEETDSLYLIFSEDYPTIDDFIKSI